MIIGLLDKRWETRHGCSLGLMGLLQGLGLVIDPDSALIPRTDHNLIRCSGQNTDLGSTESDLSTVIPSSSPFSSFPPSSNFSSIPYSSSLPLTLSLPHYLVEAHFVDVAHLHGRRSGARDHSFRAKSPDRKRWMIWKTKRSRHSPSSWKNGVRCPNGRKEPFAFWQRSIATEN